MPPPLLKHRRSCVVRVVALLLTVFLLVSNFLYWRQVHSNVDEIHDNKGEGRRTSDVPDSNSAAVLGTSASAVSYTIDYDESVGLGKVGTLVEPSDNAVDKIDVTGATSTAVLGQLSRRIARERNGRKQSFDSILKPFANLSHSEKQIISSGPSRAHCVNRGMQSKCLIRGLVVSRNRFSIIGDEAFRRDGLPNPIYPPDGQKGPLIQYHSYRGHPVRVLPYPPLSTTTPTPIREGLRLGGAHEGQRADVLTPLAEGMPHRASSQRHPYCDAFITRPTVFLFRMSGHSTYHLWENNLGPFFATLNEGFGLEATDAKELQKRLLDPSQLVVSYVDNKPRQGPKAPHLLNKLLTLFSNVALVNASEIGAYLRSSKSEEGMGIGVRAKEEEEEERRPNEKEGLVEDYTREEGRDRRVCFTEAVVGISSNHFPHRELLYRMMERVAGYGPPHPLPLFPSILFISRNHKSVVRGRKIANEKEAVDALNASLHASYIRLEEAAASGSIDNKRGNPHTSNDYSIADRLDGDGHDANTDWGAKEGRTRSLAPYSFRVVHMEDYSFEDQIRLAMRTHIIFSPHGGGVTNCIWMREGSVTVEFVAPAGKTLTNMYHSLCGKSGVTHFHFLADPDPADEGADLKGNARLFSNMVVPPERLVENGQKALRLYIQNRENYMKK